MSKVYVVTGANRGIGLALVTELSSQGHKIIATARTPATATKLRALRNVSVVQAEMSDLKSLTRVAAEIAALAPEGIDELWNNAGANGNAGLVTDIDFVKYHEELAINVVAPGAITQGLLPLLRKKQTRKIVFITSIMGSGQTISSIIGNVLKGLPIPITEDVLGMSSYCSSKSALTMQAIGWNGALFKEGFVVAPIHPGWVRTDMARPEATLSVEESVAGLLKTIGDAKPVENLVLLNYNGETLPW
ncbi:NAD(P)-binding protein [Stipitochalara longipes BDJ]|nr:NAD(P)-binding protein [Stipitochalara longipes BDJ]